MTKVMMVAAVASGGVARHVRELAGCCRRRGFDVHVVCAASSGSGFGTTWRELRNSGVVVDELDVQKELNPVRDGAAAIRLRQLVLSSDPDVLHLHSSKAGALGRAAMLGLGARRPAVLYTPHAYAFMAQAGVLNRWAYWCVERVLTHSTDCFVAVSESEGSAAARLATADRVVVIANGIDATQIVSKKTENRRDTLRIGWLGRLVWQKHPEIALKISKLLSSRAVAHQVLLGGEGPAGRRVRAMIRQDGAEQQVRMLGHVHDTEEFYDNIDVLLITSRAEGLPYAGLDAMAHSLPIMGFDVPGVRDLVDHGVTGMLSPPGDIRTLADYLAQMAGDEDLRLALGAAGRQRVQKTFRLAEQVNRLCCVYRSFATRKAATLAAV